MTLTGAAPEMTAVGKAPIAWGNPKRPATLWSVAYRLGPSYRGLRGLGCVFLTRPILAQHNATGQVAVVCEKAVVGHWLLAFGFLCFRCIHRSTPLKLQMNARCRRTPVLLDDDAGLAKWHYSRCADQHSNWISEALDGHWLSASLWGGSLCWADHL